MIEESKLQKKTSTPNFPPAVDTVNEMLTIETMFQIKDSATGEVMDLREILDLDEADF